MAIGCKDTSLHVRNHNGQAFKLRREESDTWMGLVSHKAAPSRRTEVRAPWQHGKRWWRTVRNHLSRVCCKRSPPSGLSVEGRPLTAADSHPFLTWPRSPPALPRCDPPSVPPSQARVSFLLVLPHLLAVFPPTPDCPHPSSTPTPCTPSTGRSSCTLSPSPAFFLALGR